MTTINLKTSLSTTKKLWKKIKDHDEAKKQQNQEMIMCLTGEELEGLLHDVGKLFAELYRHHIRGLHLVIPPDKKRRVKL